MSDTSPLPQAFFKFTLNRNIEFNKDVFAISVSQQGDRLGRYRLKNAAQKFEACNFSILLGSRDGKFIKADAGADFLFYLDNNEIELEAGEYIVMIDPIWNECAERENEFRQVMLDIYCTEEIEI